VAAGVSFFLPKIIDQFKNDDQKPQKTIKPMEIEQENTVQKEPQEAEIFEDDFMAFQDEEINISTSQQNLAKLELMRIESIEHMNDDVHWTMNDQWREVNGGGLLPAQNFQTSTSCTACAVTALVQLFVSPFIEWDRNTANNILNTGYEVYKRSVNNTEVISKEKHQKNPLNHRIQFVKLGGFLTYNQIVSPISLSNHNIEHKAEFDIFSNSRLSDENYITLRQGINRFFDKGGISGV
jgi:hypothetical protein